MSYTKVIEAKSPSGGKPWVDNSYTQRAAQKLLPKVGETLIRTPNVSDKVKTANPTKCKVVYINTAHLWYMVVFENGFRECFKVPEEDADEKVFSKLQ